MTDDEVSQLALAHAAARELLAQTRDYLLRLPPVPLTKELARRIDEHLTQPHSAHARRLTEAAVRDATRLTWGKYMPNGEHMLDACVEGRTLTLMGVRLRSRPKAAKAVLEALDGPLVVTLTPDPRRDVRPPIRRPPVPPSAASDAAGTGASDATEQP